LALCFVVQTVIAAEIKILPSNRIGGSVSISGDFVITGDYVQEAAYIYQRREGSWTQRDILRVYDGSTGGRFGYSVGISGSVAVVGDYNSDSAYVFCNGTQVARLQANDWNSGDYFGFSVAASGNYIIIGAPQDDNIRGQGAGAAYIFHLNDGIWSQMAKLTASDGAAYDTLGYSVSISGNYAIVGAYQDDDDGYKSGSAYIFHYNGTTWSESEKFTASNGAERDTFGWSVSISGLQAIVGAPGDSYQKNTAYIFSRTGSSWTETAILTPDDVVSGDKFGDSVSIFGDYTIVGAPPPVLG